MLYVNDSTAGGFVPAQDTQILEEARAAAERRLVKGLDMSTLDAVKAALPGLVAGKFDEAFWVAFINPHAKLIAFEEMFRGTATMTPVFPRQVVKRALDLNASHLLLVHNHPSGEPIPSDADVQATKDITKAANLFDIRVLDHLIVGGGKVQSIVESGRLNGKGGAGRGIKALLKALGAPDDVLEAVEGGDEIDTKKGKVHDAA
jgi:DNA repair protein RadC